ncbi:MAG: hypothetical protein KAW17_13555 [Candidatus Eisenbacteria sp.]|nr:hypothetical protein [Candidatus Eisenbacteria bacterium]
MRIVSLLTVIAFLGLTAAAFAGTPLTSNKVDSSALRALKDAMEHGYPDYAGRRVGGEDMANATAIPGLPFTDSGNTCQFLDNYDEACPYTDSTSPDVVYFMKPPSDIEVDISLCNSYYDTKVYVYDAAGMAVACNDDACDGPNYSSPYLSCIQCLQLAGGQTYYIVVDGYGGDCGEYILDVSECVPPDPPCDLVCPEGAILEQEPECFDLLNDVWNGGCNSDPPVFQTLQPDCDGSIVVCGTSAYDYSGSGYRDTDWYEIILTEATELTLCVVAQFAPQILIVEVFDYCNSYDTSRIAWGPACEPVCLTDTLEPGKYWLWVGPDFYENGNVPCGWGYIMTVDGFYPPGGPSATKETSWGAVKGLYR